MPKDTFFNLSKEKYQKIIDAGFEEFNTHKLKDAKIASIVKRADIPRGSFYQYFDNLSDFYFYLIDIRIDYYRDRFLKILQEAEGDFFIAVEKYGIEHIQFVRESGYRKFYMNVYDSVNTQLFKEDERPFSPKIERALIENINFSKLKISESEIYSLFKMALNIVSDTLYEGIRTEESVKVSQDKYCKRLHWLRDGIKSE